MTHSSQRASHRGTCIDKKGGGGKKLSGHVCYSLVQRKMTHSVQRVSCIDKGGEEKEKNTFWSSVLFIGAVQHDSFGAARYLSQLLYRSGKKKKRGEGGIWSRVIY